MIHTIGREKSKEYTQEELDNRYKYDRCKEKGLLYDWTEREYFVRYCSDPYDGRDEHLILLKTPAVLVGDIFLDVCAYRSSLGYHILQNPPSHQSQPDVRHIHLLKS